MPGWVDYDGAAYGLGDLDGRGVKVAPDGEGPEIDPERAERVAVPEHGARRARLRRPPLPGAGRCSARRPPRHCQYELTADTHFVLAPHPERAAACG